MPRATEHRKVPAPLKPGRGATTSSKGPRANLVVVPSVSGRPRASDVAVDPLTVKVAVVTEAFGSQAEAAEFLGVARSQPGKWLRRQERPGPRVRRLLQDFEYVWDRLTTERAPDTAHIWLNSANAFLNGATPLTWLRTRGPDGVIAAIDSEEAGSYA